jgi:hypothetical protein
VFAWGGVAGLERFHWVWCSETKDKHESCAGRDKTRLFPFLSCEVLRCAWSRARLVRRAAYAREDIHVHSSFRCSWTLLT